VSLINCLCLDCQICDAEFMLREGGKERRVDRIPCRAMYPEPRFQLVEPECTKCLLKAWVNKALYLSRYHQCALLDGATLLDCDQNAAPRLGSSLETSHPTISSTKQLVAQLLLGRSTLFLRIEPYDFSAKASILFASRRVAPQKRGAATTTV